MRRNIQDQTCMVPKTVNSVYWLWPMIIILFIMTNDHYYSLWPMIIIHYDQMLHCGPSLVFIWSSIKAGIGDINEVMLSIWIKWVRLNNSSCQCYHGNMVRWCPSKIFQQIRPRAMCGLQVIMHAYLKIFGQHDWCASKTNNVIAQFHYKSYSRWTNTWSEDVYFMRVVWHEKMQIGAAQPKEMADRCKQAPLEHLCFARRWRWRIRLVTVTAGSTRRVRMLKLICSPFTYKNWYTPLKWCKRLCPHASTRPLRWHGC